MKTIVTIKGKPVIEIYESFNGSYWYVTQRAWKQDSLVGRRVHKNDQILYGYVKLASCPQFSEFGYFSEAELKQLGWRIWKVNRQDWTVCPDVEVHEVEDAGNPDKEKCGTVVAQSSPAKLHKEVARK
jgi:hypothetical protein